MLVRAFQYIELTDEQQTALQAMHSQDVCSDGPLISINSEKKKFFIVAWDDQTMEETCKDVVQMHIDGLKEVRSP